MESKEIILEVRPLSWEENIALDEFMSNVKDPVQYVRKAAPWVIQNAYKIEMTALSPAEVFAVYQRTMQLTNSIRVEEIKNLKLSPNGSASEENTVQAAENQG